jgi:hypothetical protein
MEKRRAWSVASSSFPFSLEPSKDLVLDLPEIVQGYHDLEFDAEEGSEIEASYLLPEGESSGKSSYIARAGYRHGWEEIPSHSNSSHFASSLDAQSCDALRPSKCAIPSSAQPASSATTFL